MSRTSHFRALLLLLAAGPAVAAGPADRSDAVARTESQIHILDGMIEAGLPEEALRGLAEVRAGGADDPRLDVIQAHALHLTGLEAEALVLLETHLRRHKRDAEAWALLGVVHADGERLPEAIDALERALRLAPRDAEVLNNLGYVELAAGRPEKAVQHLRASLTLDASQPRTRNNLGFALARMERDVEALEAFRAANGEADARYNLGVACEMRGDRASAINHFQAALSVRPDHPGAASALQRLLTGGTP